jgi:hypothetical protein
MTAASGYITATPELEILRVEKPRRFGRARVLVRDPDGNERWAYAGDTIRMNVRITIGSKP